MPEQKHRVGVGYAGDFNNGVTVVGAVVVRENPDGSLDVHAAEGDGDNVVTYTGVHVGDGPLQIKGA